MEDFPGLTTKAFIPWWRTDLGILESNRVAEAIRARRINEGPLCRQLELRLAETLQVPFVTLAPSGTSALLLSLMACGVEAGDEVIIPAAGFVAAAHAGMLLGARVRLVDVLPDRGLIDPDKVRRALGPRTKAIVPMHLNGMGCDISALRNLVDGTRVRIVEDAAQAFGSWSFQAPIGTQGDLAAFSMGLTKLITTGEGGFIVTHDKSLHDRIVKLRNQGVLRVADNIFDGFGMNLRFTDLQAAVGLTQLDRLPQKISAVHDVYRFYAAHLAEIVDLKVLEVRTEEGELPLWTQVICARRDLLLSELAVRGIEARPFHPCLSQSPHLKVVGEYPASGALARCGLTLPSGPDQPKENLQRTVDALKEIAATCRAMHAVSSPRCSA